jgi:hypothetical protein
VFVEDLAGLLVGLRIVAAPLPGGEGAQRRVRHLRPLGEQLERRDERVAAEQGPKATRVMLVDRRRAGVDPPVRGEHLLEQLHYPLTAPAVMPATMRFWKMMTSATSGMVITTEAALMVPRGTQTGSQIPPANGGYTVKVVFRTTPGRPGGRPSAGRGETRAGA